MGLEAAFIQALLIIGYQHEPAPEGFTAAARAIARFFPDSANAVLFFQASGSRRELPEIKELWIAFTDYIVLITPGDKVTETETHFLVYPRKEVIVRHVRVSDWFNEQPFSPILRPRLLSKPPMEKNNSQPKGKTPRHSEFLLTHCSSSRTETLRDLNKLPEGK